MDEPTPETSTPAVPRVPLFGLHLAAVTYDVVVDVVAGRLREPNGRPLTADAANTMTMAASCRDPRLYRSLAAYDMVLPDGVPLVWCMKAKGADLPGAVAGPYLIEEVLSRLPGPTRVGLIGGFPDQHRRLVATARERFPLAEFVLLYDAPAGLIDQEYVDRCVDLIEQADARLVFVMLGVPRQYYWTALAAPRLGGRVALSVGGAFAYLTGDATPAPRWMQRAGLWWLHRLLNDRRRLLSRYVRYNTLFVWLVLTRELLPGRFFRDRVAMKRT